MEALKAVLANATIATCWHGSFRETNAPEQPRRSRPKTATADWVLSLEVRALLRQPHAWPAAFLPSAACAAASRAIGTRNGEHEM